MGRYSIRFNNNNYIQPIIIYISNIHYYICQPVKSKNQSIKEEREKQIR
jgi:hypothetical protein